jgi:tyrosyl-tRNA synthetase
MNKNQIQDILTRNADEVIDKNHLSNALLGKKKLRIKLGIDPTASKIHIGRAVVLWKLRAFQELGHKIVIIIGDFTGLIGDTSDKDSERPMLTVKQVEENMKDYMSQVGKILDLKKTEIRYNSEWLKPLGYLEICQQADLFGLNEFISRENISKRLKAGKRVSFRETMYPLMQGYDSVAIKADVELGGTDQRFNLLSGRTIQRYYKQEPQDILTVKLLEGTDGRKMSSSWGNVINIMDEPNDMFGKTMAIRDDLIVKYFEATTRLTMEEVKSYEKQLKAGANPRDIKKRLAYEMVMLYHGKKAAEVAEKEWEKVFSAKEKPTDMVVIKIKSDNLVDALVESKLTASKSEARRLVEQGGVRIDDIVIKDWKQKIEFKSGSIIQVGKRKFIKVK